MIFLLKAESSRQCKSGTRFNVLLDTNICIYIINKKPKNVIKKFNNLNPDEIKISTITVGELEYGVSKSIQREQNRIALRTFLSPFKIITFDLKDAEIYGIIRSDLENRGELIAPYDCPAHAELAVWTKAYKVVYKSPGGSSFLRGEYRPSR